MSRTRRASAPKYSTFSWKGLRMNAPLEHYRPALLASVVLGTTLGVVSLGCADAARAVVCACMPRSEARRA
jgi:hypothetical protein